MPTPRKSLTKDQIGTAVGLELLQLLERITDDGKLEIEEIQNLQGWLINHRSAGIPAIDHLIPIMARIAEDGVVSPIEIQLIQDEVENVLPVDIRQIVKFKRKHYESEQRETTKLEASKVKELNRKLGSFNFFVIGINYEGRSNILKKMGGRLEGANVILALESNNPYDPSAVAVIIHDKHVGYVPREESGWIAGLLSTERYEAQVKKVLDGQNCPIPVVGGVIFNKDNTEGRGVLAKQKHFTGSHPKSGRGGRDIIDDDDEDDNITRKTKKDETTDGAGCMYLVIIVIALLLAVIVLRWIG